MAHSVCLRARRKLGTQLQVFHRESHSMHGLSASTHRFPFLHIFFVHVLGCRDDLFDVVLSGGDTWFAGSSLRHYSVLGNARVHLHHRTQSRNEWLQER